ncbi:MAG TPA: hypothetical protein VFF40_05350 [Acidimicrobiia bacterium]|nr:hypothetical protein [Acidimicrobiia bacterium]
MQRDREVAHRAASRHGMVHRADGRRAGLSAAAMSRRRRAGRWERRQPHVDRIAGAPATWRSALFAAVASAGGHALVSHRSAGALWQLEGLQPGPVELSIPNHQIRRRDGVRVRRVTELEPRDATRIDEIPVTRIERTLIDLAAALSRSALATALDSALAQGLTRPDLVSRRLEELGRRGRKGAGFLAQLLRERTDGQRAHESGFERRLARLLVRAGLPAPARQFEVRDGRGFAGRVDLAYPLHRLAIEADSYRWHSGHVAWGRDLARRSRLAAARWRVLHFTWHDVMSRPEYVIGEVRHALASGPDP